MWLNLTPRGGTGLSLVNSDALIIVEEDKLGYGGSRVTTTNGDTYHYHETVTQIASMLDP